MKKIFGGKKGRRLLAGVLLLGGVLVAVYFFWGKEKGGESHRMRRRSVKTGEELFLGLAKEEAVDTRKFQLAKGENREYVTAYLALIEQLIAEEEYEGIFSYNLIYVNGDKTPELVVNKYLDGSNTISMYTCMEEELIEVLADWPNGEYSANHYIPYKNTIRYVEYENQLLDIYTKYYQLDEEGKLKKNYSLLKKYEAAEDEDIRYNWEFLSTYEEDTSSWRYFSRGEKISHQDYSAQIIEGAYEGIVGNHSAQEMKEILFSRLLNQEERKIEQSILEK